MRWFDWIKPSKCEIPECSEQAVRSSYILRASGAWLCQKHAAALDVGRPGQAEREL